ncbi:F0F1 ATP synthase subunit B [Pseudogracilibacillus auburnensis]|uniref:F0F1 ATP synthase subunit B n=1 Tax=Pseudogracilibacillus auburnensis TaxID=1494959 RepID=UPI001A9717AE|nr:F0F1 ATP synthase subunit B [Pseudogracilibacillus auburnensis]MBO1004790.1 F0F1 ATP synthase subunit B [Pseudogracilibacillus auburnensis]
MLTEFFVLGAATNEKVFNGGDILYTAAAFLVLMLLLKKFAWGPLMGIMIRRENYIAHEIEAAEKSRTESSELLEQQKTLLKEARLEAQSMIENSKEHGEVQRQEIIATARQEAERLKESARVEIEHQKQEAIGALREQVASLSVMIASKVIEKELNEEDQQKLINDYIQRAGE